MSKLSIIVLLVSVLGLTNIFFDVGYKFKAVVGVLTFLSSLYYTALDLYLFVRNPYGFWQKGADVLLSSLLGSVYEERKSRWSLQGKLRVYCNQIYSKQIMTEKASYMILIEKSMERSENSAQHPWSKFPNSLIDSHERRRLNIEGDERNFLNGEVRTIYKEGISLMLSIRSDEGKWENEIAWEEFSLLGDKGKNDFLSLEDRDDLWCKCHEYMVITMIYPVSEFRVILKAKLYKTGLFSVDCRVFEKWSSEEVRNYEGLNGQGFGPLFNIFYMWDYISRNPELGVVSSKKGGVGLDGRRILHCVSIEDSLSKVCSGSYVLRICQHEFGGFMVAGDISGTSDLKGMLKDKLVENFFSSPKLYYFISSYLKLRYGKKKDEIMREYVTHPSPVRFSKTVLNNWQIKRMFSDIKYIFKAMSVCHRVHCPRGIPPTKECQEIIKEIVEETVVEEVKKKRDNGGVDQELNKDSERIRVIESICNNGVGGLVSQPLLKDLKTGEESVVRIEREISLGLTRHCFNVAHRYRLENYKAAVKVGRFVKDEEFIKSFKNALLSKPREKVRKSIDEMKRKEANEMKVRDEKEEKACLKELLRFKAQVKSKEIMKEYNVQTTPKPETDLGWETPKKRATWSGEVDTQPPLQLSNIFDHISLSEEFCMDKVSKGEEMAAKELINMSVRPEGQLKRKNKVLKMCSRNVEARCNENLNDRKFVIVCKSKKSAGRMNENEAEIEARLKEAISKCKNAADFKRLPPRKRKGFVAFDIEGEKDKVKFLYNRGKKGLKINNSKLIKKLVYSLNGVLNFQGKNESMIELLDKMTDGDYRRKSAMLDELKATLEAKRKLKIEKDIKEDRERQLREERRIERLKIEEEEELRVKELREETRNRWELEMKMMKAVKEFEKGPSFEVMEAVGRVIYINRFLEYRKKESESQSECTKDKSEDILNKRLERKRNKALSKNREGKMTKEERRKLHEEDYEYYSWSGFY